MAVKPYIAEYKCMACGHEYEVIQGDFGCPEGYVGKSCGADDPAKCTDKKDCWGCSPCGRSRRRYRCAACGANTACPACGNGTPGTSSLLKWLNYEALFDPGPKSLIHGQQYVLLLVYCLIACYTA